MPNDENIVFLDIETNFAKSFINGEEKRYVKDILKNLPAQNDDLLKVLNNLHNIENFIIFANYSFDYKLYDKIDFKYEYSKEYRSVDKSNNLYVLYKNILIPVYQIEGLDNRCFYIININRMGKFCREKDTNYFDIQIFEYSNDEKHLQKTMNEKINGCDLQGEEKKNHLLECVNLVIREYVKFESNQIEGYKLFYKDYNKEKENVKSVM